MTWGMWICRVTGGVEDRNAAARPARGPRLCASPAPMPTAAVYARATRVALMTGRWQYRLPIRSGGAARQPGATMSGCRRTHPTPPAQLLGKAGDATALIGKWHSAASPAYRPAEERGYERFWACAAAAIDYFTHAGSDGKLDLWDGPTHGGQGGASTTDLLADQAIAGILRAAAKQAASLVHEPPFHRAALAVETAPGDDGRGAAAREAARTRSDAADALRRRQRRRPTPAMVGRLDGQVGRGARCAGGVSGQAENTIVVVHKRRWRRAVFQTPAVQRAQDGAARKAACASPPSCAGRRDARLVATSEAQVISMGLAADIPRPQRARRPNAALQAGRRWTFARRWWAGRLPERTLFWRYKGHGQQGRCGAAGGKYLRIEDRHLPVRRGGRSAWSAGTSRLREPDMYAEAGAVSLGGAGQDHAAAGSRRPTRTG